MPKHSSRRPEHVGPAELYYGETEARKYTQCSRMITVQRQLSERALELLNLKADETCFLLDIGCGSSLSGEVLTENGGHRWIGLDISQNMLQVASERGVEGDLINLDMGSGMPFRPGMFDGAISISALQWLCNSDHKADIPHRRILHFFTTLYAVMANGTRCVFQFYPENDKQTNLLTRQALKAGFTGGLVIDNPESTRAKKVFLVLCVGMGHVIPELPAEVICDEPESKIEKRQRKPIKNTRKWVLSKKARWRRQGKEVRPDTKYTGRKRSSRRF
ncbi:hypothetical protein ACOME3_000036 [Neoechinorhynchus agilis]